MQEVLSADSDCILVVDNNFEDKDQQPSDSVFQPVAAVTNYEQII